MHPESAVQFYIMPVWCGSQCHRICGEEVRLQTPCLGDKDQDHHWIEPLNTIVSAKGKILVTHFASWDSPRAAYETAYKYHQEFLEEDADTCLDRLPVFYDSVFAELG